jgi:uncharacterized protein (TIGR02466 family)
MKNYKIRPLFAIPLFQSTVDVSKEEKDYIINNVEYKRYPADNGFGSTSKFLLNDDKSLASLKKKIDDCVIEYLTTILNVNPQCDFQMTNSWAVRHIKGDEAGQHNHANAMLSGILYIQTDEKSGDVLFTKERNYFNLFNDQVIQVPFDDQNDYNAEGWAVKPKNNMILLFPSHLRHEVYPNESDIDRYCVAFNHFPFGSFGYDDGYNKNVQLGLKNTTHDTR